MLTLKTDMQCYSPERAGEKKPPPNPPPPNPPPPKPPPPPNPPAVTSPDLTRSMMLEVLSQDYIRTARAKGLGENAILFLHALKNAAVPIVTVIGIGVALLIGGAVVTESVFAIPGLGGSPSMPSCGATIPSSRASCSCSPSSTCW